MYTHIYKTFQKSFFFLGLIVLSLFISPLTAGELTVKTMDNNIVMEKQITILITKKTTLKELENIKKQMTDKGFAFNYSNVVYNEKNEIISISISYKDANNNTGNYSVGSENPINNIQIISNGNQISVKSVGSGNQAIINQGNSYKVSEDYQKTREEHRAAMVKKRAEMDKRMADRMQEMKERRTQMQTRMEHERDSVFGDQRTRSSESFSGNFNIINKNTTDAELLELKKTYQSENIKFSYNQLERDASNLITRISITINNSNGSRSTSSFGNGKDPIKDVSVGVDPEHTIMKSAE